LASALSAVTANAATTSNAGTIFMTVLSCDNLAGDALFRSDNPTAGDNVPLKVVARHSRPKDGVASASL
jgi:hypothetical protein